MVPREACPQCGSTWYQKKGHIHTGKQNHGCKQCGWAFVLNPDNDVSTQGVQHYQDHTTHWLAWGAIVRGWALAERGQGEEGIAQIRQGLTDYLATGAELFRSHHLTLLAEAYGQAGQTEEGLDVLVKVLEAVNKTGEWWYEAKLYRLKGELTLQQSSVQYIASRVQINQTANGKIYQSPAPVPHSQSKAEACFRKALEIARKQQAKSLELRAVVNLARLWRQRGKKDEARQLLAEIHGWFTEEFETKDLQEAKVLLDALS